VLFAVSVTDKGTLWLRLIAEGRPGHGGVPSPDNPVEFLSAALARLRQARWPLQLQPAVRDMLRAAADMQPQPWPGLIRVLVRPSLVPAVAFLLRRQPMLRAMLQTTVSVTGLRAGEKENVIPERAEAILDVRLLPGQDVEQVLHRLRCALAEPRIRIEVLQEPRPAAVTPYAHDPFFAALAAACREHVPGCQVAPFLSPGTTDSGLFRPLGYKAFGLVPSVLTRTELERVHGTDERISVENLILGTRIIYDTLSALCT
jgi:acetylornithine deacetylase/succinyl-diaminopimelate desuccinylase-like protein